MINKTSEVIANEEFEDDSDYGKYVKRKNKKVLIKLKKFDWVN